MSGNYVKHLKILNLKLINQTQLCEKLRHMPIEFFTIRISVRSSDRSKVTQNKINFMGFELAVSRSSGLVLCQLS